MTRTPRRTASMASTTSPSRTSPRRWRTTATAGAAVLAMTLAGCAGSPDPPESTGEAAGQEFRTGLVGEQTEAEPQEGGRLDVSAFGEVRSLDPAQTIAGGLSGGSQMAAIYDVLLRYDPESGDYVPQLAEGIDSSDDATHWTLTLREDVRFSDGTPLDADAVVASIQRYVENGGDSAALWQRRVQGMEATDEHTVVFTLRKPWPEFEYMLASGPGMIVAPTADSGGQFTPIGAGPFVLVHKLPDEELLLAANEDYWGGEPPIEELRFTTIQTAQGTLDVLESDGADVGVLREPNVIAGAIDAGMHGWMNVLSMGVGLIMNHREESATADVRVRRAIAMALDPEVIFERTYEGVGLPGSTMFPETSRWHTENQGPQLDLEAAKKLVSKAKADGFDGTVRYLGIQRVSVNTGTAIEAMLGRVGLQVEPEYVSGPAAMIEKVFVNHEFDLAGWSFGAPDAAVFPELFDSFHSESSANAGGYASAEMDALIEELGTASTDEAQQEVLNRIQAEWNESIPAIVFGAQPEFVAWQPEVHGIVPHVDSIVLYHDAWLEQ